VLPLNLNDIYKFDLTDSAFAQISLIQENDFTLDGMSFRLKIGGKGCDGFTYDTGFSQKHEDDIVLIFENKGQKLEVLLDDFTAFYCKEGSMDYFFIPHENEDGFFFTNTNEFKHHGKFFKDGDYVPTKKAADQTQGE
jgi:Fe-S cluster assembly iron-binding protein IscA